MFKKITSIGLVIMMVLSLMTVGVVTSNAATTETFTDENGISWIVTESYPGWEISANTSMSISGCLYIPATYNGRIISSVGSMTSLSGFDSVHLPNTIVSISNDAFRECRSLKSVKWSSSLQRIGEHAFVSTGLTSLVLPSSVKTLGYDCFAQCGDLVDVEISDVKIIPQTCFSGCDSLERVVLSGDIELIDYFAFQNTYSLKKVVLSDNIRAIRPYAFAFAGGNKGLDINVPVSLEYVGPGAFIGCDAAGAYFNDYAEGSDPYEITDTSEWEEFDYNGVYWKVSEYKHGYQITLGDNHIDGHGNNNIDYNIKELVFPSEYKGKSIVRIANNAIGSTGYGSRNQWVEKVVLPSNIEEIGAYAFNWIPSLTECDFPNSLRIIENGAFRSCALLDINLNEGLEYIGDSAFYEEYIDAQMPHIMDVLTIPSTIKYVGMYAFRDVGTIDVLELNNVALSQIDCLAFYGCHINNVEFSSNLTHIDTPLLSGNSNFVSLSVPSSTVVSNTYAFYGDENLTIYAPTQAVTTGLYSASRFADVPLIVTDGIIESGGSKDAIVTLTTDTANLKVTVPTVLPVTVDSDNNVTVADNAQIVNLSRGQVDVTAAEMQTDVWSIVDFNTDFKQVPVDTKQYGFKVRNDDVYDGISTTSFETMDGGSAQDLPYDANVAIQSNATSDEEIGRIIFTVAWHK